MESVCINSLDDLVLKNPKIPIFSIISCFQDEKLWKIILLDDFDVWVAPQNRLWRIEIYSLFLW